MYGDTLREAIEMGMINGEGEARRRLGMGYTKIVPVPNTIGERLKLMADHEKYGLTLDEVHQVLTRNPLKIK